MSSVVAYLLKKKANVVFTPIGVDGKALWRKTRIHTPGRRKNKVAARGCESAKAVITSELQSLTNHSSEEIHFASEEPRQFKIDVITATATQERDDDGDETRWRRERKAHDALATDPVNTATFGLPAHPKLRDILPDFDRHRLPGLFKHLER